MGAAAFLFFLLLNRQNVIIPSAIAAAEPKPAPRPTASVDVLVEGAATPEVAEFGAADTEAAELKLVGTEVDIALAEDNVILAMGVEVARLVPMEKAVL